MKPPKEKAKELVLKFGCKELAFICINEILKLHILASDEYYFNNVKKEIESL